MTKTIKSFTSNAQYFLTINEQGEAVDCSCPDHQYRNRTCKHMTSLDLEVRKAEKFATLKRDFDIRGLAAQARRREVYVQEFGIYQ